MQCLVGEGSAVAETSPPNPHNKHTSTTNLAMDWHWLALFFPRRVWCWFGHVYLERGVMHGNLVCEVLLNLN